MDFEILDLPIIDYSSDEEEEVFIRMSKRYIRDAENPFDYYDDVEFKIRFRFTKHSVMHGILPLVRRGLETYNNRGLPIALVLRLLICLRFYATSSFQVCNKKCCYILNKSE